MTFTPLVQSKLIMPELPVQLLYSDRLKELAIGEKRITVLTAPAGFGKTTMVLLALKKESASIRWYRLEQEDTVLSVFYTHMIETLFQGRDKHDLDCHRALTGIRSLSEEYPLVNALICQDAAGLETGGKRLYLVLDDFHEVVGNGAIVDSVRYFAANLPDFISIVVTSRVETNIVAGKLAISPAVLSITVRDLRLTREETEKLVTAVYRLQLNEGEMSDIFERSEGWVAGIYMLCQSRAFSGFDAHTDGRDLFKRYFRGFFNHFDTDRQDILAKLSILPDFSAYELSALFGYEQADEFLYWLEKSNLYVQRTLMEEARYRFHALFLEELQVILSERYSQPRLLELYLAAADFFRRGGNDVLAIRLLLRVGEKEKAAAAARERCIRDFNCGCLKDMGNVMNTLPEDVVTGDPYLVFFKSVAYQNVSHEMSYNCAVKAMELFKHHKDTTYLMNAFGMILVIAFQTNDFEPLKKAAVALPVARILFGGGDGLSKLLISAASGFVANERFAPASLLYRWIDRLPAQNSVWHFSALMIRGILLYRTGRLEEALRNFDAVMNHPVCLAGDQWRITGFVAGHLAVDLDGDAVKIRSVLTEFTALAEQYNSDFARGFTYRLAAFACYVSGDVDGTVQNIEKSAEAFEASVSPVLASTSRMTSYLWQAETGDVPTLSGLARLELEKMKNYQVGHGFFELCQVMYGALLIKNGCYEDAETILLSALKCSRRKGATQSLCGTLAQLVDLYYLQGSSFMDKYLRQWADLSAKNAYYYFWEADRHTLIRACALACQRVFHTGHMVRIVERYYGKDAAAKLLRDPDAVAAKPELLTEVPHDPNRGKRKVFIKLFGIFRITAGDDEITDDTFKTRKISGVLKYILLNGKNPVSRDVLATAFWPESDAKSAFTSLRVALSELRKVLFRYDMAFDGGSTLLYESRNGFSLSTNNEIYLDTEEFLELYGQYKRGRRGDTCQTDILKKITTLYDGDLLDNTPYDEWLAVLRTHYRSIYIEASYALAIANINDEKYNDAEAVLTKHMRFEPLDEKACGLLLHVLDKTGQKERAAVIKRQFEKSFFEEMNQAPNLHGYEKEKRLI